VRYNQRPSFDTHGASTIPDQADRRSEAGEHAKRLLPTFKDWPTGIAHGVAFDMNAAQKKQALKAAAAALSAKDYKQALTHCKQVLQADTNCYEAYV
jgi:hypothetical protein